MKGQTVVTSNGVFCRPETDLAEAMSIMWHNGYRTLPVVDQSGRVIGIITHRDISLAVSTKGRLASRIAVGEVISGNESPGRHQRNHLIHLLSVGKHEVWYRLDDQCVVALHKPAGLNPRQLYYATLESLEQNLSRIEEEFDHVCPGCAESHIPPLLTWQDVKSVEAAETTLEGHRFRVYREQFEDGGEAVTVVHTGETGVRDYCCESAAELDSAWAEIITQAKAICPGCTQQGE